MGVSYAEYEKSLTNISLCPGNDTDRAIVTVECQLETLLKLSSGTIF